MGTWARNAGEMARSMLTNAPYHHQATATIPVGPDEQVRNACEQRCLRTCMARNVGKMARSMLTNATYHHQATGTPLWARMSRCTMLVSSACMGTYMARDAGEMACRLLANVCHQAALAGPLRKNVLSHVKSRWLKSKRLLMMLPYRSSSHL